MHHHSWKQPRLQALLQSHDIFTCIRVHHSWIHMVDYCWFHGNGRYTNTYEDESENGVVAKILRTSHARTFQITGFKKLLALEEAALAQLQV